jgi:long-chain acyl-CoA synthetase
MLIEPLLAQAQGQPDEIAVLDDHGPCSYQKLATMAGGMARLIAAQTDRPVVGLMLPSSAMYAASFYGSLWAGKSVVPINFLLGVREMDHVIADSGIDLILSVGPLASKLQGTGLKVTDLATITPQPGQPLPLPTHKPDDMAVLMYTSGTSGLPKGVVLTYGNLQSDVDAAIEQAELKHGHRFLGLIPLFHAFGLTGTLLAPVQLGATAIYMARFSPHAVLNAIVEHKASLVLAVPSMYGAMLNLKNAGPEQFKNIYALISGGEPLAPALAAAFLQKFGKPIYEGYGLTETCAVIALNMPHANRAGSVGRVVPGVRVRILDDDGNEQPTGQTGELLLAGPMIMKEYFHLPAETAAALTPDGYFRTGDLAKLDADGFLFIVGRKKELIIVAGEKAVPREIEEVILRYPAVAEAAVVGKKDETRGEVVVAFVTAKEGQTVVPDELREVCRSAGMPQWKIPREIFIEKDLPRSPTGKVLKRVLSQRVNSPTQ